MRNYNTVLELFSLNFFKIIIILLPRDAMHKHGLCLHAVSVRSSVCLSVTFVDHVKTNKHIFEFFHYRVATPF